MNPRLDRVSVAALLVLGIAITTSWTVFSRDATYHFTNDSFGYIDEAKNLLSGSGLARTPLDYAAPDAPPRPSSIFPPLFPILIAAVSLAGVDPANAALWISRSCWALLPLALVWTLRPMLGFAGATIVAVIVATSPGVVQWGSRAMTDAPNLLAIVVASGLFARGLVPPHPGSLVTGGAIIGAAVCLRNATIALLLSLGATVMIAALLRLLSLREALRALLLVAIGAAVPLGALWIRNLLVFGELQPYNWSSPQPLHLLGVVTSAREHLWELIIDVSGSERVAALAWDARVLLWVTPPLLAVLVWGVIRYWRNNGPTCRVLVVLLTMISVITAAMIVYANARYGTFHEYRYPMQYAWAVVALSAAAAMSFFRTASVALGLGAAVAAVVVGSHVAFLDERLGIERVLQSQWHRHGLSQGVAWLNRQGLRREAAHAVLQMRLRLARDERLRAAVLALPENAYVVASDNYGSFLHFELGRRVRNFPGFGIPEEIERLASVARSLSLRLPKVPVYYVLIPDYKMMRSGESIEKRTPELLPPRFVIVEQNENFALAVYGG